MQYVAFAAIVSLISGLILVYARGWYRWPLSIRHRRLVELRKSIRHGKKQPANAELYAMVNEQLDCETFYLATGIRADAEKRQALLRLQESNPEEYLWPGLADWADQLVAVADQIRFKRSPLKFRISQVCFVLALGLLLLAAAATFASVSAFHADPKMAYLLVMPFQFLVMGCMMLVLTPRPFVYRRLTALLLPPEGETGVTPDRVSGSENLAHSAS